MGKRKKEIVHRADNGDYVVTLPPNIRRHPSPELRNGLENAKYLGSRIGKQNTEDMMYVIAPLLRALVANEKDCVSTQKILTEFAKFQLSHPGLEDHTIHCEFCTAVRSPWSDEPEWEDQPCYDITLCPKCAIEARANADKDIKEAE